jgi:hypothetical protein
MEKKIEGQTRLKPATQSHRTKAHVRSPKSAGPRHMQPPMSRITKYSVISAVVLLAAIAGIIAKTVVQKTANPQKRPTIE